MRGNRKAYSGVEVVRMARDSGLIFAEQPRRRRWPLFVLAAGLVLLIAALPRLAVLLPAGVQRVDAALAARFVPRYEARLASLQAENTALHKHLAGAQIALAENDALRQWAGIERPAGRWQAARVVFRWHDRAELAGVYPVGAAVCDEQGRFAGRITEAGADRCTLTFAGYLSPAAAGFAGEQAGLLQKNWRLTGLPLPTTLAADTVVTTADGLAGHAGGDTCPRRRRIERRSPADGHGRFGEPGVFYKNVTSFLPRKCCYFARDCLYWM